MITLDLFFKKIVWLKCKLDLFIKTSRKQGLLFTDPLPLESTYSYTNGRNNQNCWLRWVWFWKSYGYFANPSIQTSRKRGLLFTDPLLSRLTTSNTRNWTITRERKNQKIWLHWMWIFSDNVWLRIKLSEWMN